MPFFPKIQEIKYKTELCKNWIETRQCRYFRKCKYAHGNSELVNVTDQQTQKYKTKDCNQFYKEGFCLYGTRCLFIHTKPPTSTYKSYQSLLTDLSNTSITKILNSKKQGAKRLPIFKDFVESEAQIYKIQIEKNRKQIKKEM